MGEEDGDIEQYFSQIRINELPDGMEPKFSLGDLVRIEFRSDHSPAAYQLKDGVGLVCEVLFYKCKDYGVDYPVDYRKPYYIIEYKVLPNGKHDEYRYISEENLRKVEND